MFEEYTVYTESFENVWEEDKITGFRFRIRLAMDRGIWLSTISGFYISIDGKPAFSQEQIYLTIEGEKTYSVTSLEKLYEKRWKPDSVAWITVMTEEGLSKGVHTIAFGESILTGYFKAKEEWVEKPPIPESMGKIVTFTFEMEERYQCQKDKKFELCVSMDCYKYGRKLDNSSVEEILYHISRMKEVSGIDASTESLLSDYPEVTEVFVNRWNNLLEFYNLNAVTLASYVDRLQYRTHVMSVEETTEAIERDIRIAQKLGFRNLRLMHDLPIEAIRAALPLAEELDIRLLDEIMPPGTIKPRAGRKGMDCANILQLIKETGSKHLGFCINTGLFQVRPNPTQILDELVPVFGVTEAEARYEEIMLKSSEVDIETFEVWMQQNYPVFTKNRELFLRMFGIRIFGDSVEVQDLADILPYIYDVYVRYIKMFENKEPAILSKEALMFLKKHGYRGPFTSFQMGATPSGLAFYREDKDIMKEERGEVKKNQKMIWDILTSENE